MHVSSIKIDNHSTQQKLINTFWSRIVERQGPKNDGTDILRLKTRKLKTRFIYKILFAVIFFFMLCFCTSKQTFGKK